MNKEQKNERGVVVNRIDDNKIFCAEGMSEEAVLWKKYPRPQLKREKFKILNGEWELDGDKIYVPFPPQSVLSGYKKQVGEQMVYRKHFALPADYAQGRVLLHFGAVDQVCDVYLNGQKVGEHEGGYLPFTIDITEALRWEAEVLSGENSKANVEGHTQDTFAGEVEAQSTENYLEVRVTDTLSDVYPYGKQCKNRGGMWYTPVSGIWQTVWVENVPEEYIEKLTLTPDMDGVTVKLRMAGGRFAQGIGSENFRGNVDSGEERALECGQKSVHERAPECGQKSVHERAQECGQRTKQESLINWEASALVEFNEEIHLEGTWDGGGAAEGVREFTFRLTLTDHICKDGKPYRPYYWTPNSPILYDLKLRCGEDYVETYFALRTIDIREINGVNRVCLNGEPIFLHGVLDQGYFQDGIYLPAEEEEYSRDVGRMKKLGYNMLRKHIKIEPEWFYYYCDLHGMLVVQDMVNNGHYSYVPLTVLPTVGFKKRNDKGGLFAWEKKAQSQATVALRKRIFREHTRDTIDHLYNHPCIIAYTIFNEGWGQFDSDDLYEQVKALDPSRLVDSTSGWFAQEKNDFDSEHIYFRAKKLRPKVRPMFLSECGGFSLPVEGHRFNTEKSYGYGACKDKEDLTDRILAMYKKMVLPAIKKGLCGCVYTQLSDVEDEINGLYTYDREVCKVNENRFRELAEEIEDIVKYMNL